MERSTSRNIKTVPRLCMHLRCTSCSQEYSLKKLAPSVEKSLNEEWKGAVDLWKKNKGSMPFVRHGLCYQCKEEEVKAEYTNEPERLQEKLQELQASYKTWQANQFGSQ